jgi:hypothetical protein
MLLWVQFSRALTDKLLTMGLAESTQRTYNVQLGQYKRFAAGFPSELLWEEVTGALWILHCWEVRKVKKNTLKGKVAAFKYGMGRYARQEPAAGKFDIFPLLNKAITKMPDDVRRKDPIGEAELLKIFGCLPACVHKSTAADVWVWWIVAYGAMLRGCETSGLRWDGIHFEFGPEGTERLPVGMKLTLQVIDGTTYKTHTNAVQFNFRANLDSILCPVRGLYDLRRVKFLCGESGPKVFDISKDYARDALKTTAAMALQRGRECFGLHSLRAGAATDAEMRGFSMSSIMFMGRWRSPTVLVYLRSGQRMLHDLGLASSQGAMHRTTLSTEKRL